MTQFVHIDYPLQHPGVERIERAVETVQSFHLPSAVLTVLAAIGRPAACLLAAVGARLAAWQEARRLARADAQIWEMAKTDARLMADLSRTMAGAALRDARE